MKERSNLINKNSYVWYRTTQISMILKILIISISLGLVFALSGTLTSVISNNSTDLLKNEFRSSIYLGTGNVLLSIIKMLPIIIAGIPLIGHIKNDFAISSIYVIPRKGRIKWFLKHTYLMFFYSTFIGTGYVGTNILVFAVTNKHLVIWSEYFYISVWILILYILFSFFFLLAVNVLSLKFNSFVSLIIFIISVALPNLIIKNNREYGIKMFIAILNPLNNFELQNHHIPRFIDIGNTLYDFFTPAFSTAYFLIIIFMLIAIGAYMINKMDLIKRK